MGLGYGFVLLVCVMGLCYGFGLLVWVIGLFGLGFWFRFLA
jgi:type IV secretory pathway TrbD component